MSSNISSISGYPTTMTDNLGNVTNLGNCHIPNITYSPPSTWTTISQGVFGMKTSNSVTKIAAALNKAQRNIGAATKGTANPFFRSKYADLGSVMEACKEALNDQGISILQPVVSDETGDYVETMLLHESGEYVSSRMKLVVNKPNMQELGSAISYARRYGLQSMVFIPAEDDDGEHTMRRGQKGSTEVSKVNPVTMVSTTSTTPNVALTTTETLPPGAIQATEVSSKAEVQPLKKSSFRKPKKVVETPAETTGESNDDWS